MEKKNLFTAILIIALVGMGIWYVSDRNTSTELGPIKLGLVASITGPGASDGENIQKGAQLAVEEINTNGGIHGRRIELIIEDDSTNPQKTVSAVQKLADVDGVVAIIGPQWDFLANAAIPVIEKEGIVAISTKAPFDTIVGDNQRSKNFFTTFPSIQANEQAIRSFFDREEVRSVVIIATQNDWGTAHVNAYTQVALKSGANVLDVVRLAETDNNDYKTQLAQIKQLDPDAILLGVNEADTQNFIRWYHELALSAHVLGNEKLTYLFSANKVSYQDGSGMYYYDFRDADVGFAARFEEKYGKAPQVAADTSYDAVYVLAQAIEKGGATRTGILKGMRSVKNYAGASGPINFSVNNFPQNKRSVLKFVTASGVQIVK